MEKIIIIGSGPAGQTAAVYCARAALQPLLFEGFLSGGSPGGQLMTTNEVENFPGFPEGITGPKLMERLKQQSEKYGTRFIAEDVESVDLSKHPFTIRSASGEVTCRVLILATGATARRMGVPGEARLWNRGISACAVCDGALPFFRNRELVVVGGGDTAVEEAVHLTQFASKVTLVHRRDTLRASRIMETRAKTHPKIDILWNTILLDALGENKLEAVRLQNVKSGVVTDKPAAGLFYAIGHVPNTGFLNGQLATDETGYILTQNGTTLTSVPGVFACGDVQDKRYRQAASAAGSGCMAALDAKHYLDSLGE